MSGEYAHPERVQSATVRAALTALAGQPLDDLLVFWHLKKWTIPCFADFWNASHDTARRALRALHAVGVIGCLQGRIRPVGGREPDLYFLTRLGARVLTRHLGLGKNQDIRAPTVASDGGEVTAGGLVKHKVAAKPGQDVHDVACLRLAVHFGWLGDRSRWQTREALRYATTDGRWPVLVPDFFLRREKSLWCVELEGTTEWKHIRDKHRRYFALCRDLERREAHDFRLHVTLVFTGEAARIPVRRLHERAYVTQDYAYSLSWATLDDALARPWEGGLGPACEEIDFTAARDWRRDHLERQLRGLGR